MYVATVLTSIFGSALWGIVLTLARITVERARRPVREISPLYSENQGDTAYKKNVRSKKLRRTISVAIAVIMGVCIFIYITVAYFFSYSLNGHAIYNFQAASDSQHISVVITYAWDEDIRRVYINDTKKSSPLLLGESFFDDIEGIWSADGTIFTVKTEGRYALGYDFINQRILQAPIHVTDLPGRSYIKKPTVEEQNLFIVKYLKNHGGPGKVAQKGAIKKINWLEVQKY